MVTLNDLLGLDFDILLNEVGNYLSSGSSRILKIPISKTVDIKNLSGDDDFEFKVLIPHKSYLLEKGYDIAFIIGKAPDENEFDFYSVFDMGDVGTLNPIYTGGHMDHKIYFNNDGVTSIEVDVQDVRAITTTMGLEAILSRPYIEKVGLNESHGIKTESGEILVDVAFGTEEFGIVAYHPRLKIAFVDVIELGAEVFDEKKDKKEGGYIDTFGELQIATLMSKIYNLLPYPVDSIEYLADFTNTNIERTTLRNFGKLNMFNSELMRVSQAVLGSKNYLKESVFRELSFVTFGLVTGDGYPNADPIAKYALEFLENEYEISGNRIRHFNGIHSEQLNLFRGIKARLNPQTGTLFMYGLEKNQQVQLGNYHVLR